MHRLWVGLDPHIVLSVLGSFIAGTVLVIHLFAFKVVNHPGKTMERYYSAPAATR